ncbi:MAG: PEP-CTERM sorting domain-containing protein [Gemmatimonadota bacterium]|nr:PEP-CTERM sorting domain-containing protein [Gemmatimonadota bacterium]MDQ8167409.1 PEP-CTERM sorting domain-containing protein [Gemmatimonadota bacterium]MDQ8172696.1 PEP-CTERM sorting domain-containing protein [Gemmatimonadota bacterium]
MRFPVRLLSVACVAALLPLALSAQGGQVVGANGVVLAGAPVNWTPNVIAATAEVTAAKPCGLAVSGACSSGFGNVGAGSLHLNVDGAGNTASGYPGWAFYYLMAQQNSSFGKLSELSALSFDWFRSATEGWDAAPGSSGTADQPINPIDWRYKTPVVRVQLRETRGAEVRLSELVWEGYYNKARLGENANPDDNWTPVEQWVAQTGMQNDNFWYIRPPSQAPASVSTPSATCNDALSFWSGGVQSGNTGGLFGETGCLFGADVDVIGIAVGLGSQWPLEYDAYVDNVRMGFNSDALAVDANFDVVPEPSSWLLMGAGLAALGLSALRRRRPSV